MSRYFYRPRFGEDRYFYRPRFGADEPRYFYRPRFGADPSTDCRMPCYDAKSAEYQTCQGIPVTEPSRSACFKQADRNLADCLKQCPPAKMGGVAVLAAGAAAAVLLLS